MTEPLPPSPRRFWVRPIIFVLLLGLLVFLSYCCLSFRNNARVYFSSTCSAILLPQADTLPLPAFHQLYLRGFNGSLEPIRNGLLRSATRSFSFPSSSIQLTPNELRHTDPTSMTLTSSGRRGESNLLVLPAGTRLQAALADNTPRPLINLLLHGQQTGSVQTSAEGFSFSELNRLLPLLPTLPSSFKQEETLQLQVSPPAGRLLRALFTTQSDTDTKQITLQFDTSISIPLWQLSISNGLPLVLQSCRNPIVALDDRSISNLPSQTPLEISLTGTSLTMSLTGWQLQKEDKFWLLKVAITGTCSSLRVFDKEQIPTFFDKIVNGSIQEKGLLGLTLVALTYILVTLFKRAIDTLANVLLPDPPKGKE